MPSATDPRAHSYWIKVDSAGHQLRADAAASYLRMIAAGMPANGVQVFRRTWDAQAALRKRYLRGVGPIAAVPSWGAPHIQGVACDFYTPSGAAFLWAMGGMKGNPALAPRSTDDSGARARAYGWYRTVPSERWHLQYDPKKDTKAAADLARRLKVLGYTGLKSFQRANGLAADGVAGKATWFKLLTDPKPATPVPAPVPVSPDRDFRFVQVNWEADRFGDDDNETTSVQADWAAKELKFSLSTFQELPERARKPFYAHYGGETKAYVLNYLGVMARASQWTFQKRAVVLFDDKGIHGAVRATLLEPKTGHVIDVISVHVRPLASAKNTAAKLGDVRKALGLVRKGVPTIFAGDLNTAAARAVVLGAGLGFKMVTPDEDTVVKSGVQKLDMVAATPEFITRKVTKVRNPHSDHYLWLWQGTLPKNLN